MTEKSDNLSCKMLPSTISKSISLPQIRPERPLARQGNSTSSVGAVFASSTPNDQEVNLNFDDIGSTSFGLPKHVKPQRHVHFSDNMSPAVCRICHGGEASCPFVNGEPLISPCHCSGSMGLYHRSCLEKWLSTSNRDKCEICKFQYVVERRPKSWIEFMRNPGSRSVHRNMLGDTICLCTLTPMALASCWLCIAGAVAVAESGSDAIAVPGLISLAVFLMITYFVWLSVSLRYHFQIWCDWRSQNQIVHLVFVDKFSRSTTVDNSDDNNNASPQELVQLQPMADIHSRRSTEPISANAYDSPWPHGDDRRSNAFDYQNPAFVWETAM